MKKSIIEEKTNQLFDYLNDLLNKYIYPYSNQTSGSYKAVILHNKISDIFSAALQKFEKNINDLELLAKESSFKICQLIDDDISSYLDRCCNGCFYIIDFNVFQNNVSRKIKNIMQHNNYFAT